MRLSFKELLVKYEKKGADQKQESRPYSTRDANSLPRHQEPQGFHQQQGNCADALYPFVGSYMPLSWPYPFYCASSNYNSMYMQPYIISIQNMVHYNNRLLAIVIWLRVMHVLLLNTMRTVTSKIQSIYSQGDVPQACLTLRREDCNECARKSRWSNR